jgi:hexokinase
MTRTEEKISVDESSAFPRLVHAWVARWKATHPAHSPATPTAERDLLTLGFGGTGLKLSAVYKTSDHRVPVAAAPNYAMRVEHEYGAPLGEAGIGLLEG